MRLNPPVRRKSVLSLTPLIDVVFLLLIFFMLASTFLKYAPLPITAKAGNTGSAAIHELALIDLKAGGEITLNGQSVSTGTLPQSLTSLMDKGIKRAVIRVRDGANVQDVVQALQVTRKVPLENVVVVK